jgi:hypothetical protein
MRAGTLTVIAPSAIESGTVTTAAKPPTTTDAKVNGPAATFANSPADASLSVQLKLKDGTTLQGVDMSWYNDTPSKPDAGELLADDREAIRAIVQDVPSFYNKSDILLLQGDHDRAVALVQLVRDSDFYSAGGNMVWRIELYYFKFQYGGWEKVQQQNKIVRRERFKTMNEYKEATDKLKWVEQLGGVRVGNDEVKTIEVTLPDTEPKPE